MNVSKAFKDLFVIFYILNWVVKIMAFIAANMAGFAMLFSFLQWILTGKTWMGQYLVMLAWGLGALYIAFSLVYAVIWLRAFILSFRGAKSSYYFSPLCLFLVLLLEVLLVFFALSWRQHLYLALTCQFLSILPFAFYLYFQYGKKSKA